MSIVTGDAVELQLPLAQFPTRLLGLLLDVTVQLIVLAVLFGGVGVVLASTDSPGYVAAALLVTTVLVLVGLPAAVETFTKGKSLGKLATGLRVVRLDGGPVRFRHSLVRALAMFFIDLWLTSGVVGTLTSVSSKRAQRVGDMLAGTMVVRERVPRAATFAEAPVYMPPQLTGWAGQLQLATLPDELAMQARSYLTRWHELNEDTRVRLGMELANRVSRYVSPPPPPGTPPTYYLSAVVAERSRRAFVAQAARYPAVPGMPPPAPGSAMSPPMAPTGFPPAGPRPQPVAGWPTGSPPPSLPATQPPPPPAVPGYPPPPSGAAGGYPPPPPAPLGQAAPPPAAAPIPSDRQAGAGRPPAPPQPDPGPQEQKEPGPPGLAPPS